MRVQGDSFVAANLTIYIILENAGIFFTIIYSWRLKT